MYRHCEKAFSADEAIFMARITSMKGCFVVPPRNDDFSIESINGSLKSLFKYLIRCFDRLSIGVLWTT
jgi:hypothetical protein